MCIDIAPGDDFFTGQESTTLGTSLDLGHHHVPRSHAFHLEKQSLLEH